MNKVIILDVDQTLIDAVHTKHGEPDQSLCYIKAGTYYVYLRPHILEFIDFCFAQTPFVIIWSAGTEDYINDVINFLLNIYQFYRVITRTTYDTTNKNVDLLLTDDIIKSSFILFVDDKPHRILYKNAEVIVLEIEPYFYKKYDTKLVETQSYIEILLSA